MHTWAGLSGFASPYLQRHIYGGQPGNLRTYGDHFTAYEATPTGSPAWTAEHSAALLDQAPGHVRILPRIATDVQEHDGRLDAGAAKRWRSAAAPLLASARVGPILVPWKGDWSKHSEAALESLVSDLWSRLPATQRVAVEFRDPSWFRGGTLRLLEEYGAGLVWSLRAGLAPYRRTSDFLYVRLTGTNKHGDEVPRLMKHLKAQDPALPLYVISTHHHEPYGVATLRRFVDALPLAGRSGNVLPAGAGGAAAPPAALGGRSRRQPAARAHLAARPPALAEPLW